VLKNGFPSPSPPRHRRRHRRQPLRTLPSFTLYTFSTRHRDLRTTSRSVTQDSCHDFTLSLYLCVSLSLSVFFFFCFFLYQSQFTHECLTIFAGLKYLCSTVENALYKIERHLFYFYTFIFSFTLFTF
jgi:hypothetical protein